MIKKTRGRGGGQGGGCGSRGGQGGHGGHEGTQPAPLNAKKRPMPNSEHDRNVNVNKTSKLWVSSGDDDDDDDDESMSGLKKDDRNWILQKKKNERKNYLKSNEDKIKPKPAKASKTAKKNSKEPIVSLTGDDEIDEMFSSIMNTLCV